MAGFTLPVAVVPELRWYQCLNTDLSSVQVWGAYILLALGNLLSPREDEQRNTLLRTSLFVQRTRCFKKISNPTSLWNNSKDNTRVCISATENLYLCFFLCLLLLQMGSWRAPAIFVVCLSAKPGKTQIFRYCVQGVKSLQK